MSQTSMRQTAAGREGRGQGLNLARQPFRNQRPIVRLAVLLWLVGGVLLVINAFQYWGYFTGSGDRRVELEQLQAQIAEHRQDIDDLEARFRNLDLRRQNAEVRFLNRKISERTFSWSGLFDRLADVLPNDVRLVSLSPETGDADRGRASRSSEDDGLREGEIALGIVGVARSPEAQLEFIEALFEHPAFRDPDLSRDSLSDGQVRFDMTTVYLPDEPKVEVVEVAVAEVVEPGTPAATGGVASTSGPGSVQDEAVAGRAEEAAAADSAARTAARASTPTTSGPTARTPQANTPSPSAQSTRVQPTPQAGQPRASRPQGSGGSVLQPRPPSSTQPSRAAAQGRGTSVDSTNRPVPRQPNASSPPNFQR